MSVNNKVYANFLAELDNFNYSDVIFLCIGTNKVVGDSFGPIIGEILKNNIKHPKINIIGNLKYNVNANNIIKITQKINKKYYKPYIVSIDSALGDKFLVGKIYVLKNKLDVGKALKKDLCKIGDVSIKGIVGINKKDSKENFKILQNVNKDFIYELSQKTSKFIIESIKFLNL